MRFTVLCLHPQMILSSAQEGLLGKAVESGLIQIDTLQIREFSEGSYHRVDDRPFGGGPGMILQVAPIVKALRSIQTSGGQSKPHVVVLSARGKIFNQAKAKELSNKEHVVLIAGRYEGIDQRVADFYADEELSLGEFVLMGGEVAANAVIEACARLVPGVLGNEESPIHESFSQEGYREAPQYTRPREFEGHRVPEVLVKGDHQEIEKWRRGDLQ